MPLKSDRKLKLGFIGAGTVGTALAVRLSDRGYPVVGVSDCDHESAERFVSTIKTGRVFGSNQEVVDSAELVFVTTPDSAISVVASKLQWHARQSVIHCSGADSTDILEPARRQGVGRQFSSSADVCQYPKGC